jgi:MoxR-like ATPase
MMTQNTKTLVKITQEGADYIATDIFGEEWTADIDLNTRKLAFDNNRALERNVYGDETMWVKVPIAKFKSVTKDDSNNAIKTQIANSIDRIPETLIVNPLKWKFAVRTILRGECIMVTGPAGCGKTSLMQALPKAMGRPYFHFNLGATQDPKSSLLGNSHLNTETGTYFVESEFIEAIQTENAIIGLDELSRANPEGWNIIMPMLDPLIGQITLDERADGKIIKKAPGVTFIATANIGSEYTSTRQMDWAMVERFTNVEMDILNFEQEVQLLTMLYPNLSADDIAHIAETAIATRDEVASAQGKLSSFISTRTTKRLAGLVYDGFSFGESFEAAVFSQYDADGGAASERNFIKKHIQQYETDVATVNPDDDLVDETSFDGFQNQN